MLRVPRLRAVPRGAALDERPGHRPDRRLRGRPDRARRTRSASTWRGSTRRALGGGWLRWLGASSAASTGSLGTDARREQDWKGYAKTVLVFSVLFFGARSTRSCACRAHLFLNPDHLPGVPSHIALNTTASFVTNTNWQYYGGEYTMSYLTQMAGLAVQNFVSAAVGMAVLAAVIRGLSRRSASELGNFWATSTARSSTSCCRWRSILARDPDLAGRAADVRRARDGDDARGRARRRSRAARSPRRSRSSSSARTAAASTTQLGRAVREPERAHELPRGARDPADPGGAGVHVREDGRSRAATRWMVFAAMFAVFAIGVAIATPGRAARLAGAARLRA